MGWTLRMIGSGVKSILWFGVKAIADIVVRFYGVGMGHTVLLACWAWGDWYLDAGAVSSEAWYELVQRKRLIGWKGLD